MIINFLIIIQVKMQRRNILPLNKPMLKAYLHIGFPFSIIPVEWIQNGWIFNSYIQLVYHTENPNDAFMDFTQQYFWEDCNVFTKGYLRFPAKKDEERNEIMQQLEFCLKQGFYIYGEWNEYFIPGMPYYGKKFYRHYFLVYGFDEKNVYSVGYREDAHWHRFQVDKEQFVKSLLPDLNRDGEKCVGMNIYRPDLAINLSFDYEKIRRECKSYLDCEGENSKLAYGLDAVKNFFDDVILSIRKGDDFPIQSVYVVYEQKLMMQNRLQYIIKNGNSKFSESDVLSYSKLVEAYYGIVCFCIKYKISRKSFLATRIERKLNEMYCEEEFLLRRIFDV